MFNAKKKLLHYMKEKSNMLEEVTGRKLYHNGDYEDIDTWEYHSYREVMLYLKVEKFDCWSCPQCMYHRNRCVMCEYGLRHGDCDSPGSLYYTLYTKLKKSGKSINQLFAELRLVHKYLLMG